MLMHGWGNYPVCAVDTLHVPPSGAHLQRLLQQGFNGIPRGLGRSYGDSALAQHVVETRALDHFLEYRRDTGILHCEAGLSLSQILHRIVPDGWFLPVIPGTQYVSVGGAIASDVHGKNHHVDGCFSNHVLDFDLLLADGRIVCCSRTENAELFHATCGGMGLTGIILRARLQLKAIASSRIRETTTPCANLEAAFEAFAQHSGAPYSVAWIDCLARGPALGRSLLYLGEHAAEGGYAMPRRGRLRVPFRTPGILLNHYSIQAFNALYYQRGRKRPAQRNVHFEPYFFPLDRILHWNRLYGRRGFVQYQFVLPMDSGVQGMHAILSRITAQGKGSFLAVLKAFGPGNRNLLSFPLQGYTLALDFKLDNTVLDFLAELDHMVADYGGRIYLTKDARMSAEIFRRTYPNWMHFQELRAQTGADRIFHSVQSQRLGL